MEILTDLPLSGNPPEGRGCGRRRPEMPYGVSGLWPGGGVPIWDLVIDPVIPWGRFEDGEFIPDRVARGARIVPRGDGSGMHDIIITVGQRFNGKPASLSPWDFVVECGEFGASRALSKMLDFEKLTPLHIDDNGNLVGSRMIFLHAAAYPRFHYEVEGPPPLSYYCVAAEAGHDWDADNPQVVAGWHPEGFAYSQMGQPEPSPCAFGLRDLSYILHTRAGSDIIQMVPDTDVFRVDMPSVYYTGTVPKFPTENDVPDFDGLEFSGGLFLAMALTGFEFAHKADEETKERLENIGFQVSVLDY